MSMVEFIMLLLLGHHSSLIILFCSPHPREEIQWNKAINAVSINLKTVS